MITYKIKYACSEDNKSLILKYQRQYSSCLHWMYNRVQENILSNSEIEKQVKQLNNLNLLNCWFIRCSLWEAKQLKDKKNIIFGGKKLFIQRCKNKISKEEFYIKRLSPLYSIGEITNKSVKGNRFFHIEQDLNSITFKPNRNTKISLNLSKYHNRQQTLAKLYQLQEEHKIKITYKLNTEFIYISFEESDVSKTKDTQKIVNRVLGIDMNPNYIGWSIVDWKSETEFNVIESGIYNFKNLNDKEKTLKKLKLSSESKERKYINNKRKFEVLEVSKNLINKALYYKVESVIIEDLNIKSKDNQKGKKFNKLVNNQWVRNDFVNNLAKRCNIFKIRLQKVQANYSSFIGNFVFRSLNLPDPVLASIELGRRGYEFINQYITQKKEIKKNIIWVDSNLFNNWIAKSLEEFSLKGMNLSLFEIYSYLKTRKIKYRVPVTSIEGQVFEFKCKKSNISYISY